MLRLSGPGALDVARQVFSRNGKQRGQPWQAQTHRIYYGHIVDRAGTVVDEVRPCVCRAQQSLAANGTALSSRCQHWQVAQAAVAVSEWSAAAAGWTHADGWTVEKTSDQLSGATQVLALVMLAPRSYTAEDVVELHCHGGAVCARRVLACCLAAGARLARPGEFTLRAFLNGRLDLTQVCRLCVVECSGVAPPFA